MELPKYFIIKRDASNPLWQKYIDWLNKTYESYWNGEYFDYYGYDGNSVMSSGTMISDFPNNFKNNPTLLTLEQWDEIVNFPKNWCIKANGKDIVGDYFNLQTGRSCYHFSSGYYHRYNLRGEDVTIKGSLSATFHEFEKRPDYVEITFEQFKKHVLGMKKYTIEELKTNEKLLVYIDTKEEFHKIVNYCGRFVSNYYGKCCYSIVKRSYSGSSTKTDVGSYDTDSIIVTFDQIDFGEQSRPFAYRTIKKMPTLPIGTIFTEGEGGWVSEDGQWGFKDDVITDTEFFEPLCNSFRIESCKVEFSFDKQIVSFEGKTYSKKFIEEVLKIFQIQSQC